MNQGNPPPDDFPNLDDIKKWEILRESGVLCGFMVDKNDGPVKSNNQVATCKTTRGSLSSLWFQEQHHIDTEIINTQDERDSNYAHKGWSLSATSNLSTWASIRIQNRAQTVRNGSWCTKRTVNQKLAFCIALRDLKPAKEFESEIQVALNKPNPAERFQALYQAFDFWGDVVPLVFELGTSLVVTDLEDNIEPNSWLGQSFKVSGTARINMQGGDPQYIVGGIGVWMTQKVSYHEWRIVRVLQTAPTTALLQPDLQKQLVNLASSILSYEPSHLEGGTIGCTSWDDTSYALKIISQVIIKCGSQLDAVCVQYTDNTTSRHGGSGGREHVFVLRDGEYISDVILWNQGDGVCAIQFITTAGRVSVHYGGSGGTPTLLSSEGGVLSAISGRCRSSDARELIHSIQTIWRHDIIHAPINTSRKYSEYIGGTGGGGFNDWSFFGPSYSAYISRIDIKGTSDSDGIHGIQFTYAEQTQNGTRISQAPYHGGPGGIKESFQLGVNEHIVAVAGARVAKNITQLRFTTNQARTSEVFGGSQGTIFTCQPQTRGGKSMRLIFVAGRCGHLLDGLLLVWAPLIE